MEALLSFVSLLRQMFRCVKFNILDFLPKNYIFFFVFVSLFTLFANDANQLFIVLVAEACNNW